MNETALIVVEKSFNAFTQFMDQLELNLKNEIKINEVFFNHKLKGLLQL